MDANDIDGDDKTMALTDEQRALLTSFENVPQDTEHWQTRAVAM
jgi:hypothetical protein